MTTEELLRRIGAVRSEHPAIAAWRRYAQPIAAGVVVFASAVVLATMAHSLGAGAILAVAALVAFLLLAYEPWRRGAAHVTLHSAGFVVRARSTVVVDFDAVDEVWFELDSMGPYSVIKSLRLVEHDKTRHVVHLQVEGGLTLANAILRNCSLRHVTDARRALADGQPLTFANVVVSAEGVTIGGSFAPWKALKLVRLVPGSVAFLRSQTVVPWRSVRLDKIPHPSVFLRLVQDLAPKVEVDPRVPRPE